MADFDTPDDTRAFIDDPDLKKRHATALSQFKLSASYFSQQRKRELEDLKFVDFDEQWDPAVKTQRAGQQAVNGLPPTPARPTLTINQLRGPCQQVASQRRNARLALTFSPKGGGATQDIAEVYEDIARGIQQESRANVARNWAADRAEKAGLGWYRIDTEYSLENPTDANDPAWNDQEIVYRRILNQSSVYPDPHAQEPDFSDGKRLFITQDLPWAEYKASYPDSQLASVDESELTGIGDAQPNFVFTSEVDGEQGKTIRIAEYWEVVETVKTRVRLSNGETGFDGDELPEGVTVDEGPTAMRRAVKVRTLMWSKINAVEYLEGPVEWNGSYIPIIPVIGEESNVGGERRWTGIVRPGRDAAISYNVMRSAQVETIGLATKAPYIGYFETIEPYLDWWKQSNIRNFFMLPIKAVKDAAGNFLPPPKRNVEEPAIQAITLAAHEAKDDVHTTTGVPPVALGQLDPHERSGKAIQALQQQAETGAGGYLDNLVNISMAYEGRVLRDLIPRIMDRPGRIVPAVGVDEQRRLVMLNYPYLEDPKTGDPVPVPNWQEGQAIPEQAKYYNLAQGEFGIAATVGKSYATRRQEASTAIGNVLQVVPPEMAAAIAPAWLEEQDYPGAKKIAEIAKKSLPPQLAAAYQDEGEQAQIPPEAKAMIDQLQQAVQQMQQIIQTDQVKQQGQIQTAQLKAQADTQRTVIAESADAQRAQQDNATKLEIARIQAQTELAKAQIQAQSADQDRRIAILEKMIGIQGDLAKVEAGHTADAIAQSADQQHDRDMTAVDVARGREADDRASDEAERQRQHEATLTAQQQRAKDRE